MMYGLTISDEGKDRDENQRSERTDEREPEKPGWLASLGEVNSRPRYSERWAAEMMYMLSSAMYPGRANGGFAVVRGEGRSA